MAEENQLVSMTPSSTDLHISLHPLVLLTISDQITRHQIRKESSPIVGALLGQQVGREITVEQAFECRTREARQDSVLLHDEWFEARLQQYKDVHKDPALDLVGWFTLTPLTGPTTRLVPLHNQFLSYNEAALLLTFHLSELSDTSSSTDVSAKLPLTVYETIHDVENSGGVEHTDHTNSAMQIDGEESVPFRLRSAPYSIETGETEMIGINYVAKGGGNASLASPEAPTSKQTKSSSTKSSSMQKPKGRSISNGTAGSAEDMTQQNAMHAETREDLVLKPSEADLIASLSTRLNSVRMLESRIHLLQRFLSSLSPTNLSDPTLENQYPQEKELVHIRSIASLLKQLSLLTPRAASPSSTPAMDSPATPQSAIHSSSLAQTNDTTLVDMLSNLTNTIQTTSEMGRKFAAIDSGRHQARSKRGLGAGNFGGNGFGNFNSGGNTNLLDEGYDGDVATPFG